ncbi:MAG: hypothetical protein AAFU54_07840 [Chloroflexota bacterium]
MTLQGMVGRHALLCIVFALVASACTTASSIPTATLQPTDVPFPTITPGSRITGFLPTPPPAYADLLANPATAVAAASLPTPTPDYATCPPTDPDASLPGILASGTTVNGSIVTYLNNGGIPARIEQALTDAEIVTSVGTVRNNFDITGEGTPEIVVAYGEPENQGSVLLLTCESGRYVIRYQNTWDGNAPELLRIGDMNADGINDMLFAIEDCSELDELCEFRAVMVTWNPNAGTFYNLMNLPPDGDSVPQFLDVDSDGVVEIITQQTDNGNSQTGPIRTGSRIYDWNGETYVLSVSQPNPIRFLIQAVHEADRAFREERYNDAARLYLYAFEDGETELGYWFGGAERDILRSYILYRILLTFVFAENGDPLSAYEQTRGAFPNLEEAPIYARMSDTFWQSYQESNNLNVACTSVQELIRTRTDATQLLNRYGTRNPTYTPQSLCPF